MTAPRTPRDFMAAHTETFIVAALARGGLANACRILEVDAGDGRLAAGLAGRGHQVTALEKDAKRAGLARGRGARVVELDFLGDTAPPYPAEKSFEAVLFTRVLHHLSPLALALDRAASRVAAGGLIVGEEFAWERADQAALDWIRDARARAVTSGLLEEEPDPPRESLHSWRHYHGEAHRLHLGTRMIHDLAERFELLPVEAAPYLYRYLCTRLADTPEAGAFAATVFEEEREAIAAGRIPALALRFIARPRG